MVNLYNLVFTKHFFKIDLHFKQKLDKILNCNQHSQHVNPVIMNNCIYDVYVNRFCDKVRIK